MRGYFLHNPAHLVLLLVLSTATAQVKQPRNIETLKQLQPAIVQVSGDGDLGQVKDLLRAWKDGALTWSNGATTWKPEISGAPIAAAFSGLAPLNCGSMLFTSRRKPIVSSESSPVIPTRFFLASAMLLVAICENFTTI